MAETVDNGLLGNGAKRTGDCRIEEGIERTSLALAQGLLDDGPTSFDGIEVGWQDGLGNTVHFVG